MQNSAAAPFKKVFGCSTCARPFACHGLITNPGLYVKKGSQRYSFSWKMFSGSDVMAGEWQEQITRPNLHKLHPNRNREYRCVPATPIGQKSTHN